MNNKEIISNAKESSRMVFSGRSCGYDQYRLQHWDNKRNAWIESSSQYFYQTAKQRLHESYIEYVLQFVLGNCQSQHFADSVHNYSDWRQYARYIINHARENNLGIFSENN